MKDPKEPFFIAEARGAKVPLVLSVPHSGTEFPSELKGRFVQDLIAAPDDTDWFVHELYSFAPELGITVIHARYSRWVIDLNRDPSDVSLYTDGRLTTELVPTTTFAGEPLYIDAASIPDYEEKQRRLAEYYLPYHARIRQELGDRIERFGHAALWDAHSIRRHVPTIRPEPFPDMILGDNDGTAAEDRFIRAALANLRSEHFSVNHNDPFKGGFITRSFGDPSNRISALQLEMSKDVYMDDSETSFDERRAEAIRKVLRKTLEAVIEEAMR